MKIVCDERKMLWRKRICHGFESFEEESIISRELENNETVDEGPLKILVKMPLMKMKIRRVGGRGKETVEVKSVTLFVRKC